MANVKKALTGKRVYRMSSHAPTRGNVNPAGYVKREVRKRNLFGLPASKSKFANGHDNRKIKVGGDGKSDTRSGLAQQALARNAGGNMNLASAAQASLASGAYQRPPGIPGVQGSFAVQHASNKLRHAGNKKIHPGWPGGRVGPPTGPRPNVHAVQNSAPNSAVHINAQGLLELPYDFNAGMDTLEQMKQANNSLLDLNQQGQSQALQYGQDIRNAAQAYQQQQRQTLNGNAARGTSFSSAHALGVSNDATGYNNQVNGLNASNSAFQNSLTAQRNQIQQQFQDFLRQQAMSRYNGLSGQLGTLGYGR